MARASWRRRVAWRGSRAVCRAARFVRPRHRLLDSPSASSSCAASPAFALRPLRRQPRRAPGPANTGPGSRRGVCRALQTESTPAPAPSRMLVMSARAPLPAQLAPSAPLSFTHTKMRRCCASSFMGSCDRGCLVTSFRCASACHGSWRMRQQNSWALTFAVTTISPGVSGHSSHVDLIV